MNRGTFWLTGVLAIGVGITIGGIALWNVTSSFAAGQTYYVDCASTAGQSLGTVAFPWKTLAAVNVPTFGPGDSILLRRGMRCVGSLQPRGSGNSTAPITIGAYGNGPAPIIDGSVQNEAVIRLFNQEYWHIESVETTGGTRFGIYVGGNETNRVLHHFRIQNVEVHNVSQPAGPTRPRWDAGLVIVAPSGDRTVFDDVVIDTATAHDTNQFYGIHVGVNFSYPFVPDNPRSTNITIKNSTVYNVPGDGITVAQSRYALIDSNVVHDVGYAQAGTITNQYTPNGIWSWSSDQVTLRFNEGYRTHSYGVDGGVFDADHGSTNTTIEYNYAHDADGYCVAVLGSAQNTVIRYNVCSNNDRKAGDNVGDIIVYGGLDGVQIYNNTIYSNPVDGGPVIWARNLSPSGRAVPNFIKNNIIYSNSRKMVDVESPIVLDRNIYFYTGGTPQWSHNGITYSDFASFRAASLQEANGFNENPLLNDPTYSQAGRPTTSFTLLSAASRAFGNAENVGMPPRDFFGNPLPAGGPFDIGAHQLPRSSYTLTASPSSVAPGGTVTASWTAPAGQTASTDWIGLYSTGSADTNPLSSASTGGTTSGSLNLTAPSTTGTYELRYLNNAYTSLATSNPITVTASSGSSNKILNPGFENGLSPWTTFGPATVVTSPVSSGQYAAQVQANSGVFQQINGLLPNTKYVLTAQARAETAGTTVFVGVKDYGGPEQYQGIVSTAYTPANVSFTTGPSTTGALIYMWLNAGVSGRAWGDDYSVVPALNGSYTLTASPSSVAPRGTITANWTAPAGQTAPTDWIGLYAMGTANTSPINSSSTGGATSGSLNFTAPITPGTNELRYLNSSYTSLATSNPITVTAFGSFTLTASPSSVAAGGMITANWTAPAGQTAATDFIGLYATGSANTSPLSSSSTGGATSGSLNFTAPTTSGTFELRYLTSGYTSLATSNAVTVTASSNSSNKILNPGFENGLSPWTTFGSATLVTSPVSTGQYAAQVQANSGVFQQISGLLPNTRYILTAQARVEVAGSSVWVGVKDHGAPEQYQGIVSTSYTPANVTFTTGPSSTSALIYLWMNAGGRAWGDDYAVVPATIGSYTLTASPSSVASGGTITANWTAPAGQTATSDWIGLYAMGAPNTSPLNSAPTGGATTGTLNFTAPTTPGTFELRYLNSGYTSLATSNAVTVTAGAGSSNKVLNPGFENGLSPWMTVGAATVVTSPVFSGQYAAQVQANSGVFQQISGLLPNTTYILTSRARVEVAGSMVWVGVKDHGGPEQYQGIVSSGYTLANVTFTTGPSSTSALIYLWLNPGVSGRAWGDDYTISVP